VKISSRFSVAVHILCLLSLSETSLCTSEWIAGSVNTNPVIIRKVLGKLKKAGFINVRPGTGGAYLEKNLEDIDLLQVYKAVEVVEEGKLFNFHDEPNPNCPIGANIKTTLEGTLLKAELAMQNVLANVTLKQLVEDLSEKIKEKN
jgi:Rrf2 family protein